MTQPSLNEPGTAARAAAVAAKRLGVFERYLSVWVGLCMVAGVFVDACCRGSRPDASPRVRRRQQINVPIAVLIWLMIVPDDDESGFRID